MALSNTIWFSIFLFNESYLCRKVLAWIFVWKRMIFLILFIKLINCDCILDNPTIENRSLQTVNESESVTLIRNIASNPLSNASWYIGTQLLKTESSVQTTTLTIENTKCTDTNNYTVVASNGVGNNVTRLVELIVNCKFEYKVFSLVWIWRSIKSIMKVLIFIIMIIYLIFEVFWWYLEIVCTIRQYYILNDFNTLPPELKAK